MLNCVCKNCVKKIAIFILTQEKKYVIVKDICSGVYYPSIVTREFPGPTPMAPLLLPCSWVFLQE